VSERRQALRREGSAVEAVEVEGRSSGGAARLRACCWAAGAFKRPLLSTASTHIDFTHLKHLSILDCNLKQLLLHRSGP
jgi:hypothetical protein